MASRYAKVRHLEVGVGSPADDQLLPIDQTIERLAFRRDDVEAKHPVA